MWKIIIAGRRAMEERVYNDNLIKTRDKFKSKLFEVRMTQYLPDVLHGDGVLSFVTPAVVSPLLRSVIVPEPAALSAELPCCV